VSRVNGARAESSGAHYPQEPLRDAAGLSAKDIGKDLVRKAFDVNAGPLTDMQAEPGERQARRPSGRQFRSQDSVCRCTEGLVFLGNFKVCANSQAAACCRAKHCLPSEVNLDPRRRSCDRRQSHGPIIGVAGVKPDRGTIPADDQSVAVMLDFVDPIGARRRF
jgi:hypothetical protein